MSMQLTSFANAVVIAALLSCSGNASVPTSSVVSVTDTPSPMNEGMGSNATESETGIDAEQVLGTWLFSHDELDHDDALLRGPASIADDCLLVNGVVVIWHASRIEDAASAVRAVMANEQVSLDVGGSITESVHPVVASRCAGFPVWFGSPAD
jgi:hypothetical protein